MDATTTLLTARANVFVGFPLGGLLSLCHRWPPPRWSSAQPTSRSTRSPGRRCRSPSRSGKVGLAVAIVGFFAATFGAALETGLSCGYTVAQYFGWQWGKRVRPRQAARFHLRRSWSPDRRRSASC